MRAGLTLVEMLVSMAIAGIALAMVASISLRQQRVFADLDDQRALSNQLREAADALPVVLRAIAPGEGDIRDARDTAFEFRSTIASGIVCDTTASGIILPPANGTNALVGVSAPLEAGDTAWLYTSTPAERWVGYRITNVTSAGSAPCNPVGPALTATSARTQLALSPPPGAAALGAPVRITRPLRVSLYRASDGAWYLGERDWNNGTARFNTIQPLAGPLLNTAGSGLTFRYVDRFGTSLPVPVESTANVALLRIELRGQTKDITRALGAQSTVGKRHDSSMVVVALRNRR